MDDDDLKWLAKARKLRGTRWDLFGKSAERKMERQLIADYEADVALILDRLRGDNLPAAVELAGWPEAVRGFGPVKQDSALAGRRQREAARARFAD